MLRERIELLELAIKNNSLFLEETKKEIHIHQENIAELERKLTKLIEQEKELIKAHMEEIDTESYLPDDPGFSKFSFRPDKDD